MGKTRNTTRQERRTKGGRGQPEAKDPRTRRAKTANGVGQVFGEAFRVMPTAAFLCEADKGGELGRILKANESACRLYGYSEAEMVGQPMGFVAADEGEKRPAEVGSSSPPAVFEQTHRRKGGTTFPADVTVRTLKVAGRTLHLVLCRDLGGRRQAEQALQQDAVQLGEILSRIPERIFVKDSGLAFLYANESYARDRGTTQEDIIGKTDYDFFPKESAERFQADERRVMAEGKAARYESTYIERPSGQQQAQKWTKIPIRDASGNPVAVVGVYSWTEKLGQAQQMLFHWASLVSSSADAIVGLTKLGTVLSWNAGAEAIYGHTADEALGQPVTLVTPPDRADELMERVKAAAEGRIVRGYESVHVRKDGQTLDVALTISPVTGTEGATTALCMTARDVTGRKLTEKALRESEERFRLLVDTAFDGINICTYDPETGKRRLLFCNDRYVEMSGHTREELEGVDDLNTFLVDYWTPEEEEVQLERMGKGQPFFGVCSWKRPDGKENYYEWTAVLVQAGGEKRLFGFDRDITERRRTERALRESEQRFRVLVDTAFDGINICEADPPTGQRRLLFCNDRFVEMSGYAREELENAPSVDDLITTYWTPEEEAVQMERMEKGLPFFGVSSWKRPDGKENYYEWSAVRMTVGDKLRWFGVDRDITERRKTEEALRTSEERFRLLVDTAFDGINICELDVEMGKRKLLFCNDRYVEMSGYTRQELEAADNLDDLAVDVGPREEFERRVERRNQGLPYSGTCSWKRPDGKENYYEWSAIRVKVGDTYRLFGVDRDITERRRSEEALRESEERFRRLVSTVFDGINICEFDPATRKRRLLFCNDRYVEMSGRTREELERTDDLNRFIHSHLTREERADNRRRLHAGLPFQGRSSWVRPDGKENYYEFSAVAVKAGDKYHLMGVDRDVTERYRAERELAQERELFRTLLSHIPDSIYFKDTQNRFVRTSKAKGEHLGVDAGDLIGKTDADFYSPEEAQRMSADDEEIMRTGRPIVAKEEKITRRDGEVRWVSATKVPRYDEQGRLLGTVGISRDITDLKRAEEELKRRARQLEAARGEAESANKAKSDFLANIGHEIRTPMNGILGMTELALSTTLTEEQREYLEAVQHSAQTLMALLNGLLDFSKIEAGKLELEDQPFDLERVISRLMEPLAVQAHQKGLELAVDISPETPLHLSGDAHRLGQVIINLIGNAVKFTDEGEILLQVRPEAGADGDGEARLHFCVSDTGIGVRREVQEVIFESFRQGDSSTTRRYGGTGLGLAISKELVEMMQGRIWVESPSHEIECDRGGPGSTFHFLIGCRRAPADWQPEPRLERVRGARALIIDDNATNRRILHRMLSSWGMLPSEATSGEEAVGMVKRARWQGQAYDVLLLDFMMPGMDGFDVVSRLREEGDLSGTVVMMLTSSEQRDHRSRCRQLGIAHYLVKPVGSSDLLDRIMQILSPAEPPKERAREHPTTVAPLSLSVLLAEDNEVNRKVAERMLSMAGCRVTMAATGQEVLQALEKSSFDAVLMDVQLPVLDGLQTTARIRECEKTTGKHLPIIAMTAHAMKGDREKCLEAGMDGYLSKPINREELCSALGRSTAPGRPAAPGAARTAPGIAVQVTELLERVGGDVTLARELLEMFIASCPPKIEAMRSALSAGDFQVVLEGSHELRGAAANLAAKAVLAAAVRLEKQAGREDAAQAQSALEELAAAVDGLKELVARQDWTDML